MTNLVERLRYAITHLVGEDEEAKVMREAADEIERLQSTIATINEALSITSQGNAALTAELASIAAKTREECADIAWQYYKDGPEAIDEAIGSMTK